MPLVPSYIQNLTNYVQGKPIEELQRELELDHVDKLASNENSLGPSPKAIKAIQSSMTNLHRYPDATGYELRTKLADRFNIKMDNVILGAGSEGVMSTIIRTFLLSDDELISAANSFIGFRVLANASGKKVHWVPMENYHYDLERMAEKVSDYTKIIYIANPDNPMGTYITKSEFDAFYANIPDRVLIILDEAYFEYNQDSVWYVCVKRVKFTFCNISPHGVVWISNIYNLCIIGYFFSHSLKVIVIIFHGYPVNLFTGSICQYTESNERISRRYQFIIT
jgi:histidinol-phosphate aminotransferase